MGSIKQLLVVLSVSLLWGACETTESHRKYNELEATEQTDLLNQLPVLNDSEVERMVWQRPNQLLDRLGDLSNRVVADIGAGTGYFTFRLALRAQKVVAIDIDEQMLDLIDELKLNLLKDVSDRIETRLSRPMDPGIKKDEVDDVIMVNTISFIENKLAYLRLLQERIKPGGRVILVDFKLKRIPEDIAPPREYRTDIWLLEDLLEEAGFNKIITDDVSLDYQYIIIAQN